MAPLVPLVPPAHGPAQLFLLLLRLRLPQTFTDVTGCVPPNPEVCAFQETESDKPPGPRARRPLPAEAAH